MDDLIDAYEDDKDYIDKDVLFDKLILGTTILIPIFIMFIIISIHSSELINNKLQVLIIVLLVISIITLIVSLVYKYKKDLLQFNSRYILNSIIYVLCITFVVFMLYTNELPVQSKIKEIANSNPSLTFISEWLYGKDSNKPPFDLNDDIIETK